MQKVMNKQVSKTWIRALSLGLLVALLSLNLAFSAARPAQTASNYASDVAVAWFDLSMKLVRETPGFSPPVASRAYGYLGVTLYETVQPGMAGYQSLVGELNDLERLPKLGGPVNVHWPVAANAALASLTRRLFPNATPENLAVIDALEAHLNQQYKKEVDDATFWLSTVWGRSVARAVYIWSLSDGGHEGYGRNFSDDFIPATGAGLWISTPPAFAKPLQPYWGDNRPFALSNNDACPAADPYEYSEDPASLFYAEALEVYQTGQGRTQEQTDIARFWADDAVRTATPPGHWISILNQVLVEEKATLDVAAEAYAKLGIAVADSFITCWRTKYQYNVLRPISYIQNVIDPTWNTPVISDPVGTPPFPEYTSGHSVQSAAAAAVLSSIFGDDYAFTDNTHASLGLPARSFASFEAAAGEAAISRLFGGIHYRAAIENGLEQGECVGARVLELPFRN